MPLHPRPPVVDANFFKEEEKAMKRILTYQEYPTIPESLSFLEVLSRNLWWCWKPDAVELFRRIDPLLWKKSNGNPILLLAYVKQSRLEQLAGDDSFLAHLQNVGERFNQRVTSNVDQDRTVYSDSGPIAYFSMEFGIHESRDQRCLEPEHFGRLVV
jgi:starch phosphorylase